jgi:hypothetical protein
MAGGATLCVALRVALFAHRFALQDGLRVTLFAVEVALLVCLTCGIFPWQSPRSCRRTPPSWSPARKLINNVSISCVKRSVALSHLFLGGVGSNSASHAILGQGNMVPTYISCKHGALLQQLQQSEIGYISIISFFPDVEGMFWLLPRPGAPWRDKLKSALTWLDIFQITRSKNGPFLLCLRKSETTKEPQKALSVHNYPTPFSL